MNNDNLDFMLYAIAEDEYIKKCAERGQTGTDILPIRWYESRDYRKKVGILFKAMKKGVLIWELPEYDELFE